MNDLISFVERELYPRVFEMAPQIFPEFQFNKKGVHWVSSNGFKVDGSEGEKGKVYIYPDRPHLLQDYTRGGKEITTYLIESGKHNSWIDAVKYLAREVGVSLPDRNLNAEDLDRINKKAGHEHLLESINDFFVKSIMEESSDGVKAHRDYLEQRGYSSLIPRTREDAHSNKTELGFIPSREKLRAHLMSAGLNVENIDDLFIKPIGDTHKLTIPFRDHHGRIAGFAFRDIEWKEGNKLGKYLYSNGLKKSSLLFNLRQLKGDKGELIIVEGLFDALNASASGIDNVVALGSADINPEQIKLAQRYGAKSITLCLDNDTTGKEGTERAIKKIVESGEDIKVYVATLPDKIKDPDELIKLKGAPALRDVISAAPSWYIHQLDKLFNGIKHSAISDKDRDQIIQKVISLGRSIKSRVERDLFTSRLPEKVMLIGLSADTLSKTFEQLQYKADEEKRKTEIQKALSEASLKVEAGQTQEALELLSNTCKQVNIESSSASYEKLFKPITREDVIATLQKEADSFDTGYLINGSPLLIPSGAPSFIAGRTGRGKTAFLINLAVTAARAVPESKPVALFTYEENSRKILMKALNIYIGKAFAENNRACLNDHYNQRNARFISAAARDEFLRLEQNFFEFLINSGRLIIVDSKDYSDELINKIYYLHKHKQIGAVFIDYIQRINLRNSKKSSRQEDLKQICNDLADCSIDTGLPLIIGSQFNRQANDDRTSLTLNNLSEAGDIERIANMVIAVDIKHAETPKEPSEFYMKILKNRDGVAEIFDSLSYEGNTGKISQSSQTSGVGRF